MNEQLIVIAGPTASGKTSLAVALAKRLNAEIVNADSQQVYRGLDIGTGKPTAEERSGVPHHFFDIADPSEQLHAGGFVDAAEVALREIAARVRPAIVVGGTGLWIRSLLRGLAEVPGRDPIIRQRLSDEARELGAPALHERLRAVDPITAERVLIGDALRIVRALEVYELTGKPLSEFHLRHREMPLRHTALKLVLDPGREVLDERIAVRVRRMFASGLIEETRAAIASPLAAERLRRVIGYREAMQHLEGTLTIDQAIDATILAQRQYARRQRRWFAKEEGWRWLTSDRTFDEALMASEDWLHGK